VQVLSVLANPLYEIALDSPQFICFHTDTGVGGEVQVVNSRFGQIPGELINDGSDELDASLFHTNLPRESLYLRMLDCIVLSSQSQAQIHRMGGTVLLRMRNISARLPGAGFQKPNNSVARFALIAHTCSHHHKLD
jgi:hypothetical protein